MPFDPASVLLYVKVGTKLFELGMAGWQDVKKSLSATDPEVIANLQALDEEYAVRIARAKAAAHDDE